jgi:hypothetical protein
MKALASPATVRPPGFLHKILATAFRQICFPAAVKMNDAGPVSIIRLRKATTTRPS